MGRIDGDYLPKQPKDPTVTTSKFFLTARRQTESDQYSKGYNYEIVVFLSFTADSSVESGEVGRIIVFKRELDVEDYSGRELESVEIYTDPADFQFAWEIKKTHLSTNHAEEEFKQLKCNREKPLHDIVSELDNEIK